MAMLGDAYGLQTAVMLRQLNVSNGANSVLTVAGVPSVLPLNGDGLNNKRWNMRRDGYGSPDYVNNWFDVSKLKPGSLIQFRVTVSNNAGGNINGANIIIRVYDDKNNLGAFVDNPSVGVNFVGQAAFLVMGYEGDADLLQVCIRTNTNEDIRCHGILIEVFDNPFL